MNDRGRVKDDEEEERRVRFRMSFESRVEEADERTADCV